MEYAGAVIGMPFSLEGLQRPKQFFLGIYLYGWDRVAGWFHLLSGHYRRDQRCYLLYSHAC